MLQWLHKAADRLETRALDFTNYDWMVAAANASGISVTPVKALTSPTCLASIRVISESIGALPGCMYWV